MESTNALEVRMFCNKCGHSNDDEMDFCSECGQKLIKLEKKEADVKVEAEADTPPQLPQNKNKLKLFGIVAIAAIVGIGVLFNQMNQVKIPKTPEEATKIFTELEEDAEKKMKDGKIEEASKVLSKHAIIADAVIYPEENQEKSDSKVIEIAKNSKGIVFELMAPKSEAVFTALSELKDDQGIVHLFDANYITEDNKDSLVPILVESCARAEEFRKVDVALRKLLVPFSEDSFNKVLELQASLNKTYGQREKNWSRVEFGNYDVVETYKEGLAKVGKKTGVDQKGKPVYQWGLIDKDGKTVVEPQYEAIGVFLEDRAAIKKNKKWGFIDKSGKEVIAPIYDELKDPLDSSFYVYAKRDPEKIYKGFYDHFAAVRLGTKWGFINLEGKKVGPGIIFTDVQVFSEGCAPVKMGEKYGLLSRDGSYILKPNVANEDGINFDVIRPIFEGLAGANWDGRKERGLIDKSGKLISFFDSERVDLVQDFREGLASVRKIDSNGKAHWGFIDRNSNLVIDILYDEVTIFIDGIAKVKVGNKYGLIDRSGNAVLPIEYDEISAFKDGFAIIKQNGKKGFVDLRGTIVLKPNFENVIAYSNGVAGFQKSGKWGVIDEKGNVIIEPIYEGLKSFNNGIAPAKINGKWGYIDIGGYYIIEPIFDQAAPFSEGMAAVVENGKSLFVKLSEIPSNVNGQVVNDEGKSVKDAEILIFKVDEDVPYFAAKTNSEGGFKAVLSEGEYVIQTSHEDYLKSSAYITVKDDEDYYASRIVLVEGDLKDKATADVNIANALDGKGIDSVLVKVRRGLNNREGDYITNESGEELEVKTSSSGTFSIDLPIGVYTAEAKCDGFATTYMNFIVSNNLKNSAVQSFPMTQKLAEGEMRITLEWGKQPSDLDAHLIGQIPTTYDWFHVYYPVKGQKIQNAMLDKDDQEGNGFETTTIYQESSKFYKYSVFDYSNGSNYNSDAMSKSDAKVRVYKGAECIAVFDIPSNKTGNLWEVFEIRNGEIKPINVITNHLDASFYTYTQ